MSGWVPLVPRRHASHSPHPVRRSHCSAVAKARATLDRPEPGGPVNSHAWVMPTPAAACWRTSMVGRWPTRSDQTVRVAWTGRGGHARSRRGATRCWIAAAISSIGARASSTT